MWLKLGSIITQLYFKKILASRTLEFKDVEYIPCDRSCTNKVFSQYGVEICKKNCN